MSIPVAWASASWVSHPRVSTPQQLLIDCDDIRIIVLTRSYLVTVPFGAGISAVFIAKKENVMLWSSVAKFLITLLKLIMYFLKWEFVEMEYSVRDVAAFKFHLMISAALLNYFEQIGLQVPAKLLDYFLCSNKSNINQIWLLPGCEYSHVF